MAVSKKERGDAPPEIVDEPGMPERFQRTLRNLLNTPPKPRSLPKRKSPSKRNSSNTKS